MAKLYGKVRLEPKAELCATDFRKKQMSGSAMFHALNPSKGFRDDLIRKGIQPKDYCKLNMQQIKQQQQAKQQQQEAAAAKKSIIPFKMKKFMNAKPLIQNTEPDGWRMKKLSRPNTSQRIKTAETLTSEVVDASRHSLFDSTYPEGTEDSTAYEVPQDSSIQATTQEGCFTGGTNFDFCNDTSESQETSGFRLSGSGAHFTNTAKLSDNSCLQSLRTGDRDHSQQRANAGSSGSNPLVNRSSKAVPLCIKKTKSQNEEAKYNDGEPLEGSIVPNGYRKMYGAEKDRALHQLQIQKREAEAEFYRLPLQIATEGQKKRQQLIEDRLKSIEKAAQAFSKPTVIIPDG